MSYPVIIKGGDSLPFMINANQQPVVECCNHHAVKPEKKREGEDDPAIPLNLSTIIQGTMIMMSSIIAYFGYTACMAGDFECTWQKFPDISHVMGVAPLNKLYAIMLTVYSCTKQAEARAINDKLSGFVSPITRGILLLAALASFIFGPCIGFWDCYYNMEIHCEVTQIFTIGEVAYLTILVYLLHTNRDKFEASASPIIDRCALGMVVAAIDGILMAMGPEATGVSIAQIGEWTAFYIDFFVRFNIAYIIRYKTIVRPLKQD